METISSAVGESLYWLGSFVFVDPEDAKAKRGPKDLSSKAAKGTSETVWQTFMNRGGGNWYVRLAGLSGAAAVILGAYGAHVFRDKPGVDPELKRVFETGQRYHIIHSVVLLAMPLVRRPLLVGSLMTTGMALFSGSCYYHALTGDARFRKVTPYGGLLLIAGWLAIAF